MRLGSAFSGSFGGHSIALKMGAMSAVAHTWGASGAGALASAFALGPSTVATAASVTSASLMLPPSDALVWR